MLEIWPKIKVLVLFSSILIVPAKVGGNTLPPQSNNNCYLIIFCLLCVGRCIILVTSKIIDFYERSLRKYQPSGAGGTRSPSATPHRLQRRTACKIQNGRYWAQTPTDWNKDRLCQNQVLDSRHNLG